MIGAALAQHPAALGLGHQVADVEAEDLVGAGC
jgi:hypothetical protein